LILDIGSVVAMAFSAIGTFFGGADCGASSISEVSLPESEKETVPCTEVTSGGNGSLE
jgi:hypothetical protein